MGGRILVLGRVRLLHDGRPIGLSRQETTVLALLVAAERSGVDRDEMTGALWPAAPRPDLLSAVLSHLRHKLLTVGLTVTSGRGDPVHRLVRVGGSADLSEIVDARGFAGLVETAGRALEEDPRSAIRALQRAAALWTGVPYDLGAREAPRRVRVDRARLVERRERLVRTWAKAGLRTETHDVLEQPHLLRDDGPEDDDRWLLRVVRALALDGPSGADDLLDARQRSTGRYDDPTLTRAVDLVALAERGVTIRSTTTRIGVSPGFGDDGGWRRAVAEASTRPHGSRTVHRAVGDPGIMLSEVVAAAHAVGVQVIAAVGPRPAEDLAAGLWGLLLRDRSVDLSAWAVLRRDARGIGAGLLGGLLDRAAGRFRLLVVIDGTGASAGLVERLLDSARRPQASILVVTPRAGHPPVVTTSDPAGASPAGASMPDAANRWLAVGAIVEHRGRIDPVLVARVLADGRSDDGGDVGLAAAVRMDAVRPDDGIEPGMYFTDEPARRAALRSAWSDPDLARRAHRNACLLLVDEDAAIRRAEHAWRARPLVPDEQVGRLALAAARTALEQGQPEQAVVLVRRAMTLDLEVGDRVELRLSEGDAHLAQGRMSAAVSAYDTARAEAARWREDPSSADEDRAIRWSAEATLRSARRWSDPGRTDATLVARLTRLRDDLAGRPGHRDLWLRACAHLAHKSTMALATGSATDGIEVAEAALHELEPTTPPETTCDVLVEARWALFDHVTPRRARALSAELARCALVSESVHFLGEAHVCGAVDLLRLGELDAARGLVEAHRDLVDRRRHGLGPWLVPVLDTLLDVWDGRLGAADARLEDTEPGGDASDSLRQTWLGQRFWLRREQGRSDELLSGDVGRLVDRRRFFPVWSAGAALLQADVGLDGPSLDGVDALVREAPQFPAHGWSVPTLALLAETLDVLHRKGHADPVRVRVLATEVDRLLAPHTAELVLAGWPTVMLGPVVRFRARLALVLGEPERVPDLVEDNPVSALPAHQRAWNQLLRARALAAMDRPGAQGLVADAGAVARRSGATLLERELDESGRW